MKIIYGPTVTVEQACKSLAAELLQRARLLPVGDSRSQGRAEGLREAARLLQSVEVAE